MAGYRIQRISEDILRELSGILPTLKDPRISGLLSIVRVEVTNDLSYAKIHVSAVEGILAAKEAVKGLKSASGFIRRELGARMDLRKIPELIFIADDSIARSARISELLEQLDERQD